MLLLLYLYEYFNSFFMKTFEITAKITVYDNNDLNNEEKKLVEAAKNATNRAYAPYSEFNVGCAVLLENGEIISGNNQENAAYPSGLCAERVTVMYANALYPDVPIKAMSIAVQRDGVFSEQPITPCGACRQVLLETENRFRKPIKMYFFGESGIYVLNGIKDILPLSFGEEELGR